MTKIKPALSLVILLLCCCLPSFSQTIYQVTYDSKPQAGVPKGKIIKLSFDKAKIFPGPVRDYWIYVPAQSLSEKAG